MMAIKCPAENCHAALLPREGVCPTVEDMSVCIFEIIAHLHHIDNSAIKFDISA